MVRRGAAGMMFQDHFSERAEAYARSRPTYPAALFSAIAALCENRELAWDAGTGNGQAALGLTEHFAAVVASDPSERQLTVAVPHPRVRYLPAAETVAELAPRSVDLVTVAQAAHWLDLERFFAEVNRVLRPGGILALWSYGLCRVAPEIDAVLADFYRETVGPWWPTERRHVDRGYRDLPFPYPELPFPESRIERDWTLAQLGAYIGTWSAVARFTAAEGRDPVATLVAGLAGPWGDPAQPRRVEWPIRGRLGRRPVAPTDPGFVAPPRPA